MDDIIREFLTESNEAMEKYDGLLLALEKDGPVVTGQASESVASVFRIAHTLKGSCGFLGFPKLEGLTHAGENLLSLMRDGKLAPDPRVVACLFRMGDAIRGILKQIEDGGTDGDGDFTELAREMDALRSAGPVPSAQADWSAGPTIPAEPRGEAPAESPDAGGAGDRTIRVDVGILDTLMNLVGELVLVRNQMLQHAGEHRGGPLPAAAAQLDLITGELQEGVMKTRMQPIRNVWSRMPRIARDLARSCGKSVRLEMEGGATGLDKTILEAIKDPLTHILRNSIDHGIEPPAERQRLGKPAEGRIRLKAYQKGGQVYIEIEDDGAGIDVAKVAFKAMEKGLVPTERIAKMAEWELAQLIFLPGFSTAETVTNVSGRGVGMDVVKNHVERIGGSVDLANRPGLGLTLRIRIPLTLAIIPALIVKAAGQRFAIPQVNVAEVLRLKSDEPGKGIEWIRDHPVVRLRGELLPLLRLDSVFRGGTGPVACGRGPITEDFVAVVHTDTSQFGILLTSVRDTQEIVVKPMSKHLKSVVLFAGAAIMGDGKVALILDVPGLAQAASLARPEGETTPITVTTAMRSADDTPREKLLLAETGGGDTVAFPLAAVARLEEISASALESVGGREVVQSRGRLLPIVRIGVSAPAPQTGRLKLVVLDRESGGVAVAVARILDVIEEALELQDTGRRPGVRGTAILRGKAVDILEPGWWLAAADAPADRAEAI